MENIKIILENDVLVEYEKDSKKHIIALSEVMKYWPDMDSDEIEGGKITTLDDDKMIGILTAASNQIGIVFVWDAKSESLIHISEGSYAIAATIYEGKVYVLRQIYHYGVYPWSGISEVELSRMDAETEIEIKKIDFDYSGGDISLIITKDEKCIIYEGNKIVL